MGYDTLIRGLVKSIISPQFESMKMDVTLKAWIGETSSGKKQYAEPRLLRALVDFEGQGEQRYTRSGTIYVLFAQLIFTDLPIAETTPNAGQTRTQPLDERDIITLPDGRSAPVVQISGFGDPTTNAPYAPTVTMGVVIRGV